LIAYVAGADPYGTRTSWAALELTIDGLKQRDRTVFSRGAIGRRRRFFSVYAGGYAEACGGYRDDPREPRPGRGEEFFQASRG